MKPRRDPELERIKARCARREPITVWVDEWPVIERALQRLARKEPA